jgi:hypothetical protein
MTGLELFKAAGTTAREIADIVSNPCPPVVPEVCDKFSCRECWQAWLETGKPPKEKGPSDKQTTPDEEGLHPNLVEMYAKAKRKAQRMLHDQATDGSAVTPPPPLGTDAQQ